MGKRHRHGERPLMTGKEAEGETPNVQRRMKQRRGQRPRLK